MGVNKPSFITCKLFDYKGITAEEYADGKAPVQYAAECLNLTRKGSKLISKECVVAAYGDYSGFAPSVKCTRIFPYNGKNGNAFEALVFDTKNVLYSLKKQWNDTFAYKTILEGAHIDSVCEYRLDSKNLLMLSTGGVIIYSYDGSSLEQHTIAQSAGKLTSHFERLFGVAPDGYTLTFSKELEPYNWQTRLDDGGYINLGIGYGRILRLISFNEYLYCFAEKGIIRLSAYAQQSEFTVKRLDVDTGGIYGKSVVSCKDRIMYLSDKGLNIFDGYNNRVIYPELTPVFSGYNEFYGEYCRNKYYLIASKDSQRVLCVFDIAENNYTVYDGFAADSMTIERFFDNKGDVLLYESGNVNGGVKPFYRLQPQVLADTRRLWRSYKVDFSHKDKPKLLRRIRGAGGRYTLIVSNGSENRYLEIDGEESVSVNLRGFDFVFTIVAYGSAEIASPVTEVYVLDE